MRRYRIKLAQVINDYFAKDRPVLELPPVKVPPPPMPQVKSPVPEGYDGYTAEELRKLTIPREDAMFHKIMEHCKDQALNGYSSARIRDEFNQDPLPSKQQRVVDRLVKKNLNCKMVKTNSSQGIRYHLLITW